MSKCSDNFHGKINEHKLKSYSDFSFSSVSVDRSDLLIIL